MWSDRWEYCGMPRGSVSRREQYIKGHARKTEIEQWIQEDRTEGVTHYVRSLQKWRDDVVRRLKWGTPQIIRIPQCFVDVLSLTSQDVWIAKDLSVWTIDGKDKEGRVIQGRVLVQAAAIG